ncbi:sugar ABC transporter ATP-binding protein, partial [Salinispira pacifica]
MNPSDTILRLAGISKSFPGVTALDGVTLEVHRGEVHGLVGENGAGKSTLMKILSGVYRPDEGEILLDGAAVHFRSPQEAQAGGISIIFQEFSLIRNFDVTDNVFLNREQVRLFGHLDKRRARTRTRELLETIGIELDVDAQVATLSVVEQQVVEIVKALSVDARILIMDEPSAALTDHELKKLFAIIRGLKARGVTVIYISHMLEEIFAVADRVTVMKDGQVVATAPASTLTKDSLVRMMVGREIGDYFPPLGGRPGSPILDVRGLSKDSRLHDISFEIREGEIVGLAGMVGSGRNLLARCVLGIDQFDAGTVSCRGTPARFRGMKEAMKSGLGYVSDDRKALGILAPMSVVENSTIADLPGFTKFGFLRRAYEESRTREQIERLRIRTSGGHQIMETLSGGNQQKVLLSRWLIRDPDLLVISEPTRGVDVGAKAEIYR